METFRERGLPLGVVTIDAPICVLNAKLPMLPLASVVELVWLLAGARRVVRFTCSPLQELHLIRGLECLGLSAITWDRRIEPMLHGGTAGYATGGAVVGVDRECALVVVFASRDKGAPRAASEAGCDDEALGALFEYPRCCVMAFCERRMAYANGFAPIFEHGTGPFPWWSNVLLDVFGYLALSHFPCHLGCDASRERAEVQWAALTAFDPAFAAHARGRLAAVVLWQPNLGIAVARTEPRSERSVHVFSNLVIMSRGLRDRVENGELRIDDDVFWIDHRGCA